MDNTSTVKVRMTSHETSCDEGYNNEEYSKFTADYLGFPNLSSNGDEYQIPIVDDPDWCLMRSEWFPSLSTSFVPGFTADAFNYNAGNTKPWVLWNTLDIPDHQIANRKFSAPPPTKLGIKGDVMPSVDGAFITTKGISSTPPCIPYTFQGSEMPLILKSELPITCGSAHEMVSESGTLSCKAPNSSQSHHPETIFSPPIKEIPCNVRVDNSSRVARRKSQASSGSPTLPSQRHTTRYKARRKSLFTTPSPIQAPAEEICTSSISASLSSHRQTEQNYRARLNDQFSALLEALPEELIGFDGSGSSNRANPDKPLSKIEVLDLAQKHIHMLEIHQADLSKESIILKRQLEVLRQIFAGMGGQIIP